MQLWSRLQKAAQQGQHEQDLKSPESVFNFPFFMRVGVLGVHKSQLLEPLSQNKLNPSWRFVGS